MRDNPEWFDADSGRCVMREWERQHVQMSQSSMLNAAADMERKANTEKWSLDLTTWKSSLVGWEQNEQERGGDIKSRGLLDDIYFL